MKNIDTKNYLILPENHMENLHREFSQSLIFESVIGHNKWRTSLGKADASVDYDPLLDDVRCWFLDKKEILEDHFLPLRAICCFSDHPFFNGNILYREPDLIVNAIWDPYEQSYLTFSALNRQFINRKGREEFANMFMHTQLKTHVYSLCDDPIRCFSIFLNHKN